MATNRFQWSRLIKVIYRPADTIEGHIVCNMLIAQGIDAVLLGEYQQGGVGELMPCDFASVNVPDNQYVQAELILNEYRNKETNYQPTDSNFNGLFLLILVVLALFLSLSIFSKLFFSP